MSVVAHTEKTLLEDALEAEDEPSFSEMLVYASATLNDHLTLEEYIDISVNFHIAPMLMGTEILSTVKQPISV